ncbi:MAG TPA: carbohydrate ABC transporter permease [Spirochaetia bacterium]|nr:carbohydrate ABC transporter permease [Spirochaetia bacterium]
MGKHTQRKHVRPSGWVKQVFLILFSILCLFPMYYMFVTAFKGQAEYLVNKIGLVREPVFSNFLTVMANQKFPRWFLNSTILTAATIVVNTMIAALAAFAFAKMEFKRSDTIFNIVLTLMVVPPVVMVIPLFKVIAAFRMTNTYSSVVIIYTGLTLPFSVYMLTNFFKTIPDAIVSSARIDGASDMLILNRIIVPLASPAIITIILVNALWVWNELMIAVIFMQNDAMKTLMVGLTIFKSRYNLDIPVTMAGLTIATIPMLVLYFAGQKYFVRGMVTGALK